MRDRILALAHRHRRYGAGMIYLKLRQAGQLINHKRVERLYAEAGLQVRRRRRKKVPVADRQPLGRPLSANQVWSMDFVFDRTAEGRDCLAQQQAISGLWDLRAVCVCPHHGKWLIDRCPACDKSLKWNRTSVIRCQCGFDLRNVETKPAPPDVLTLTALVYEIDVPPI